MIEEEAEESNRVPWYCWLPILMLFFLAWGAMAYALVCAIGRDAGLLVSGIVAGIAIADFLYVMRLE